MIVFKNDTGISHDTKLIDAETGVDISKMLAVEYGVQITIDKDMVKAACRIAMVSLEMAAGKVEFETLNPVTGKYENVRAIEFRDGSRVEISEDGTPSVVIAKSAEGIA
jgi:hypothetical protein